MSALRGSQGDHNFWLWQGEFSKGLMLSQLGCHELNISELIYFLQLWLSTSTSANFHFSNLSPLSEHMQDRTVFLFCKVMTIYQIILICDNKIILPAVCWIWTILSILRRKGKYKQIIQL